MRTIWTALYMFFYLLVLIPRLLRSKSLKKQGREKELHDLIITTVKDWAGGILAQAGTEVHIEGRENIPEGPAIYVPNHQSNFDVPIILAHIKTVGMLAKIELKKIPIFSFWMEQLGCVFVDRKDRGQSAKAVELAAESLKKGNSFVVFPEGTRSRGKPVAAFKHGAATIAAMAGVPMVPVVIDGSYRIMEGNNGRIKKAKVMVKVLPPVSVEGLSLDQRKAALIGIREQIIKAKGD